MNCIVVCAAQRSGTTVLRKTLSETEHFHDFSEVFHHQIDGSEYNFFRYLLSSESNMKLYANPSKDNMRSLLLSYLSFLRDHCSKSNFFIDVKYNSSHHFDLIWHDPLSKPHLFDLLAELDIPILHVRRENIFAQAISSITAAKTGKWHVSSGTEINSERYNIDPRVLKNSMLRLERLNSCYQDYLSDYPNLAEILYEKMFDNGHISSSVIESIHQISKVKIDEGLTPVLQKINKSLSSRVKNLDEIDVFFKGSKFERFVTPLTSL